MKYFERWARQDGHWVLLAAGLMCLAAFSAAAQDLPQSLRVASYELEVTFDPAQAALEGDALIRFAEPLRPAGEEVVFYLHGELMMTSAACAGVELDGRQDLVFYDRDYSSVARRVALATRGVDLSRGIRLRWEGRMNPSTSRAISNYMRIDEGGVFLRSYGYSIWFPVLLGPGDRSHAVNFRRVVLKVPEEFTPVFTGTRIAESIQDGVRISEWRAMDTEIFDAQCSARPYDVREQNGLYLYHLQDEASRGNADRILEFAQRLRSFYARHYRKGALNGQLHVMQLPAYGNIGSGNAIGISDDVWRDFDEGSYAGRTLAHELVHAHVWVPCDPEGDLYALVREGFPGYFHLPALAEMLGEDWYAEFIQGISADYMRKKETGLSLRGRPLPEEKPILDLRAEDIGTYKDLFILSDRVKLFFDDMRRRLGPDGFLRLARDVMSQERLDAGALRAVIRRHLPGAEADVRIWLETNEYPQRLPPTSAPRDR